MRSIRAAAACLLCAAALCLPYRPRAAYLSLLAAAVHWPYALFGRLSRRLMERLGLENSYESLDWR